MPSKRRKPINVSKRIYLRQKWGDRVMGTGIHGGFVFTLGARSFRQGDITAEVEPLGINPDKGDLEPAHSYKKKKKPIFDKKGHVTLESIRARAEFFLGKSVARLEHELHKHGYETKRRPSTHSTSKAKIIVTLNSNKDRNISQIQVSPGSKRHGDVPYVKISTTDYGRIKIINASASEYKTDGREKATLCFRRK